MRFFTKIKKRWVEILKAVEPENIYRILKPKDAKKGGRGIFTQTIQNGGHDRPNVSRRNKIQMFSWNDY